MDTMLTIVLAILTALIWWQAFFQNNVTLFQKRMELYQIYVRKYHSFVDFAQDFFKHKVFYDHPENINKALEKKRNLLQKFADLEGATSPMLLVGFSNKIYSILNQNIEDAKLSTNFLTQTEQRESRVSTDQVEKALDRLDSVSNVDSELNRLFNNELPLRNFKFYIHKLCLKICLCCKNNE